MGVFIVNFEYTWQLLLKFLLLTVIIYLFTGSTGIRLHSLLMIKFIILLTCLELLSHTVLDEKTENNLLINILLSCDSNEWSKNFQKISQRKFLRKYNPFWFPIFHFHLGCISLLKTECSVLTSLKLPRFFQENGPWILNWLIKRRKVYFFNQVSYWYFTKDRSRGVFRLSRISTMKLFSQISWWLNAVNYYRKKLLCRCLTAF